MTVMELVQRYLLLKKGVKPNTQTNYNFVVNALKKETFSKKAIGKVKMSDAKLWLLKMQSDGRGYSSIHSIRGVVRPAFQMAVDDEILWRNPFNFEMKEVLINDSVRRESLSKRDMRIFLEFIKNDNHFKKYYEAIFILFHTGLRISEFCGLTVNDIDLEKRTINAITVQPHHQIYKAAVSESPTQIPLAQNLKSPYYPKKVSVPIFYVASNGFFDSNIIIPPQQLEQLFDMTTQSPFRVMAIRKKTDHGEMLYKVDGYVTAWFLYWLQGDENAGTVFQKDGELARNPLYEKVRIE